MSVNVGRAAALPLLQGETVISGFFKYPSRTAERVEKLGLVGDDHVDDVDDPDRAVLFYQLAHYDRWTQELGRELPFGAFGEQLTFDGPFEDKLWLGDQLAVGEAVFQVTQPRIPCRRMAARFGEEDMPIRFMRSGRTGFFCKVLIPGVIRAGDRVRLVERGPDEFTVEDLAAVLRTVEPDADQLSRALASPVLPDLLRTKLAKMMDRTSARAIGWDGERPLRVSCRTPQGTDVMAFDLVDPYGARLPDFKPGQFLTLVLDAQSVPRPLVRTYTIAGRSSDGTGYRIAVKREPSPAGRLEVPPGIGSEHLHDEVFVGAVVRARSPRGRFVLQPGTRPVVLISAGIGITPMVAMLEDLAGGQVNSEEAHRDVYFIHAARSSRHRAFGSLVEGMIADNPRMRSHLVYSQPDPAERPGVDFDATGRLSAARIRNLLPSLDADFYICGPTRFTTDIAAGLVGLGAAQEQVRYEFFGAAAPLSGDAGGTDSCPEAVDADGRPITVTFARSGLTVPWRSNSFSLLSLAETAGLRPDASCRTGLCGTCVCRLDDGDITYAIEPMDGALPGKVFLCCARPVTSVMVDL